MLLIYDHDNVLHITNEKGLRWNYDKADKPQFSFDYDYLFYIEQDDCFEVELGDNTSEITDEQKSEILEYINLLVPKGGKWSMPSNHASNMFALATIISYFYSNQKHIIYFLAIIISFSRVYVGVHYPLDVITGSLIGYTISWIIITFWVKIKLYELKKNRNWVWFEINDPKPNN